MMTKHTMNINDKNAKDSCKILRSLPHPIVRLTILSFLQGFPYKTLYIEVRKMIDIIVLIF